MIEKVTGNIFDSKCQAITNPVNCVGVMGKGLAAEFKKRYPEMFREYAEFCLENKVTLGKPYLFQKSNPMILIFPTKGHCENPAASRTLILGFNT